MHSIYDNFWDKRKRLVPCDRAEGSSDNGSMPVHESLGKYYIIVVVVYLSLDYWSQVVSDYLENMQQILNKNLGQKKNTIYSYEKSLAKTCNKSLRKISSQNMQKSLVKTLGQTIARDFFIARDDCPRK